MSQGQPKRPQQQQDVVEPIKYGDVLPVTGELASRPIAPRDAAMMQTAENAVLGQTQKGGPAATMQSAATVNERAGLVGHGDVSDAAGQQGVTVTETEIPGARIITESVGGQVVGQFMQAKPVQQGEQGFQSQSGQGGGAGGRIAGGDKITIGEALEAVAATAGDKPVEQSDAAAIQAAEARATGSNLITPGGVASAAQSAASLNRQTDRDEDKVKLGDVLTNATVKLPADKEARRRRRGGCRAEEQSECGHNSWWSGGISCCCCQA